MSIFLTFYPSFSTPSIFLLSAKVYGKFYLYMVHKKFHNLIDEVLY